ncbi:MAG: hypothetical protein ACREDJ_04710 [Methylocella sp.]
MARPSANPTHRAAALDQGKESVEIAYFVTVLTREQAPPERLLTLACEHWAIENKLHYVRDVSLGDDRCRVRAGAGRPPASETSPSQSIRRTGPSVPKARENFREDRQAAISAMTNRFL